MMNTDAIRQRLMQRRLDLLARYRAELERADEELAARDSEEVERASEEWDARVLSRLGDHDAAALAEVTRAIGRLEDGTYGICATCGEAIARPRLEALPTANTCVACARSRSSSA